MEAARNEFKLELVEDIKRLKMMQTLNANLPKIIWILWFQGLDKAPELVKDCYMSWKDNNPTWNVIFLDEKNLEKYISLQEIVDKKSGSISNQQLSDIARINLLAKFGGVWVDSTCFCCRPLDEWLYNYMKSGFFAFHKPGRDRLISSWFLASNRNCYLTLKLCDEVNNYWCTNYFPNQRILYIRIIKRVLNKLLNRNSHTTKLWFSFVVMKIFKVYPYFWFHYLFTEVVRNDQHCKNLWDETEKFPADIPHKLQQSGLLSPITETIKKDIYSKKEPLYKLTWKFDANKYEKGCILHCLLQSTKVKTSDLQDQSSVTIK